MFPKPTRARGRNFRFKKSKSDAIRRACFVEPLEDRVYLTAVAYNWQNVNIGAGGFVDGIFYDPHNQNTIYARTDIGGLYKTTNDGTSWSQLLDFVGNNTTGSGNGTQQQEIGVLSFAIDSENSNNLYAMVGEYTGTNGDVLYSTNAGASWTATPLSFYVGGNSNGRATGERIAVDPYDSNVVLLGSNANGLWESNNAGHSFSQITTFSTSASINFVYFNPYGGAVGSPTKNAFVGVDATNAGTNLFQTTNLPSASPTFTLITGTGSLPTTWMPNRAALASDGNLYVAYSNDLAPNGNLINGGVFRYNTGTGVWANISPDLPQVTNGSADKFGYVGLALDPNSSTTVVVTSFDRYAFGDAIWRTTNANAASPTWTALFDFVGYNGDNPTRNTTAAPWDAVFDDGIGNWAGDVTVNPFNSAQIMYGTGQGIWATNNGTSTSTLTAPNSWYFPDTGIEFTAVGGVAAPTAGDPLYSAMGDIGGFAHTSIAFSPSQGSVGGSGYATDYAGTAPNNAVIVGSMGTNNGVYTTNGSTFTAFSANPGGGTKFSQGTVAISASGATIVWAPNGQGAYWSTNNGSTWTKSTLGGATLPTGGKIVADKVNPNYFYYWTENANDNSMTIYISTDGGHTFNASAGGALGTGNATLVANQYVAGQLWVSSYIGMYESTNFGASFTHATSFAPNINTGDMAIGAAAPGSSLPSIYMYGTLTTGGFLGVYRSDDGGNTWLLLNDVSHQWGGLIQTLAADPNVFGRVYIGINGRGIIMGNPTTSLPAGWTDADINEPGNPGWATSSTTLSTGTTSAQWNVNGGGIDITATPVSITSLSRTGGVATAVTSVANNFQIGQTITISGANQSAYNGTFVITGLANTTAGLSSGIGSATQFNFAIAQGTDTASGTITAKLADQLNFAYQPMSVDVTVSAKLLSLTNADNGGGTPEAGIMIRNGTGPVDPFVALMQTSSGTLLFEDRSDGSLQTQSVTGIPVGSEYLKIVGANQGYTAYYSSDGTSWTQLGFGVTVPTSGSVNAGLAATASYNPQLTSAAFSNVNVVVTGPTIVNPAAANPNPVTGTSTALSALGTENGSGSGLTYTWSYTGPTGVTYTGATNGTNAAQNITANFTQSGTYNFLVTITDASNVSVTSPISVTVNQTPTTVVVSPSTTTTIPVGFSEGYSASVTDQFGNAMSAAGVNWSITGSSNSITTGGNATLGSVPGSFTVIATDGAAHGNATLIGENFAVPSGSTLDINLGPAGAVALSENGGSITASQNGVQISFTGMTAIAVTDTGSGDVLNVNSSMIEPFTFNGADTATLDVNSGAMTFAAVQGGSVDLGALSIAAGASAAIAPTTSSQPTTLNLVNLGVDPAGKFDVANNIVVISYGSGTDPITTIAGWLATGYNNGLWNGAGIISTAAQSHSNYALGYADSADPGDPANLSVHTIEIRYTLLGDADLNGIVNGVDFGIVSANFNKGVTAWDQGDFNYDNVVNGIDFADLAANFNQGASIAAAPPSDTTPPVVNAPPVVTNPQPTPPQPTTTPVTHRHLVVKKHRHRIR